MKTRGKKTRGTVLLCYNPPAISVPPYYTMTLYDKMKNTKALADCVKNVIPSEAKDLKWPKNQILRYTQNDKKQEKCFFTQSAVPLCFVIG